MPWRLLLMLYHDATGLDGNEQPYDEVADVLGHYADFNRIRLGQGYQPADDGRRVQAPATMADQPQGRPTPEARTMDAP